MRKIREVLRLRHGRGASVAEIAGACRLSGSTVHEYLYRSGAAGLTWPLPEELSDEDLERLLYPPAKRQDEEARPLPDFREFQKELSRKGVTLLLLWREYKDRHPDGYGYSRLADLYADWLRSSDVRMLQRHKAGEKLFVDFAGMTPKLTDPQTGEVSDIQVFVSAMGASQRLFALGCKGQDQESWLLAHVKAFEFYGALPEVVVPDNLKAGVSSPCFYEPVINEGLPSWEAEPIWCGCRNRLAVVTIETGTWKSDVPVLVF